MNGQCLDQVIVVQDEDKGIWCRGDVVEQAGEQRLGRGRLGGLQHDLGCLANVRIELLEGRQKVGEKASSPALIFSLELTNIPASGAFIPSYINAKPGILYFFASFSEIVSKTFAHFSAIIEFIIFSSFIIRP